jgi:hypothetical protein
MLQPVNISDRDGEQTNRHMRTAHIYDTPARASCKFLFCMTLDAVEATKNMRFTLKTDDRRA